MLGHVVRDPPPTTRAGQCTGKASDIRPAAQTKEPHERRLELRTQVRFLPGGKRPSPPVLFVPLALGLRSAKSQSARRAPTPGPPACTSAAPDASF